MQKLLDFFITNNIEYKTDVSLKDISTFRIGGTADLVCYPVSAGEVSAIVKFCSDHAIQYYAFGKCSNVVFSDAGIKRLIIKTDKIDNIGFDDGVFSFGAGVMLAKASKFTIDNSFAGMEFSYGIPGSVGGAVYMNAGAYGGQMSDLVIKTEYVDERGNICLLSKDEHDFSYRHSYFSDKNYIITKTYVLLEKGDREQSENKVSELQTARKSKQPLDFPSAGSVFKRPEGHFAGKLIQDCGLKGACIGGAAVSEKHSGFIINIGDATCEDVKQLVAYIQDSVYKKFEIMLECELKFAE